jgi:rare lipoprotein A
MVFLPQENVMRRQLVNVVLGVSCALLLSACSSHRHHENSAPAKHSKWANGLDPFAGTGSPYYNGRGAIPFAGGRYQVGKPYVVAGRTFTPHEQPGYDKKGLASWYGEAFHRRMTSNGEYFDMATLTAAHATLPLPSYAKVTNLENGKTVVVRINDRGPFVDTRVLDVSKAAADALGYRKQGTAHVRVQLIGPAPLKDKGGRQVLALNNAMQSGASVSQLASLSQGENVQVAEVKPRKQTQAMVQQVAYDAPVQQPATAGYVVRVALFHDLENAKQTFAQISSFGPAQIIRAVGANGPLYRVQIGPLNTQEDADAVLQNAVASGYDDARIVEAQITQVSSN